MRLYVLRHGRAEPHRVEDSTRQLVDSGRDDVYNVVTRQSSKMLVDALWSSPYTRALQTAEIAANVLALPTQPAHISRNLTPGASVGHLIQELYEANLPSVLFVSHLPLVGDFIDTLCDSREPVHMKTASLACIELDMVAAGFGSLQWLAHP